MTAPANIPYEACRPVMTQLIDAAGLVGRR
jgi:hypothetical protein